MTVAPVSLNRRFRAISAEEAKYPSRLFDSGFGGSLGWAELLNLRRVVVLAEAGSGKSFELKARWRDLTDGGLHACYATVQDVARMGLRAALGPKDAARFDSWHGDPDALCWFLIDSVDEAKDEGLPFETALRQIANAISGVEERAYVLISGRFSDWDFVADRKALEDWLAIPEDPPAFEDEDYRELIRGTLAQRPPKKAAEPEDRVHVVLMTPLDETRIRQFVTNAGIANADAFIAEVDHGDLWKFASRPLDLGWMTEFWEINKRLGSLNAMLEASLAARLLDPKPGRQRRDPLSMDEARKGLERIGAALHLSGAETVMLPTEGIADGAGGGGLALQSVLTDWPRDQQLRLLSRPVFDPATLGRVRLHNDNDGTVRAYLTARWLHARLAANCPPQVVEDLLFADIYGHALIRPDMVDVASWLSLWHPFIAEQVVTRGSYGLLKRGDPGSLPVPFRIKAIEASLLAGARDPWRYHGDDMLRRLADPAFDAVIPEWWARYGDREDARHLILRLIERGKQMGGLEVARAASVDQTLDATTQILAGSALAAIGSDADRQQLAAYILQHCADLPREVVLHAVDRLFPTHISIEGFFGVIDAIGIFNAEGTKSLYPIGSELWPELKAPSDLERFLAGIIERIGPLRARDEENPIAEAFDTLAVTAAFRLLDYYPDAVPAVVTDTVLRLQDHQSYRGVGPVEDQLRAAIVSSPARREQSFWRAARALREHPWVKDKGEPNIWQMQHLGWPGHFTIDDMDWLLAAIQERSEFRDRELALSAAHSVWRERKDRKLLNRIKRAVQPDAALKAVLDGWLSPPKDSPELRESLDRMKKSQRRSKARITKRDNSWVRFIDELRAEPDVLDKLRPQTADTVDSRLFHLWQLVSWRTSSRSRHSISDLSMIRPIVGEEVASRFGRELIKFAEARTPRIPSDGPDGEERAFTSFDTMGLGGISLAAATRPNWAVALSDAGADQAARYAVAELNGFPDYILPLIAAKPAQVARVINAEIDLQLVGGKAGGHGMLDRIAYADPAVAALVTPHLISKLIGAPGIQDPILPKVVNVLIKSVPTDDAALSQLFHTRAIESSDPIVAALYLTLLFVADGDRAVDALRLRMDAMAIADRTALCEALLPRLFGDRFHRGQLVPTVISFQKLEELVVAAFEGVRREDDIDRKSGEAYSPGARDHAQDARQLLFTRLAETPGEATHATLLGLADRGDFPIEREWLIELARRRAEVDANLQPWRPEDVIQFEVEFDKPPSTTADLQLLAVRRIELIEHDLAHGIFTQGTTLKDLEDENAVQRWLGDRLQATQKHVYTVERETHVADEKEPDITLHSRFSGVALPIEIKVIDEMTVPQIERALVDQLCGQYLRHREARHGILLLVHQHRRASGWKLDGHADLVPMATVLEHIRAWATAIRATSPEGPQPVVACIDVSGVPGLKKRRNTGTKKKGCAGDDVGTGAGELP